MEDTAKLICISCKKKRKIRVQMTSYQLNSTLGIYMCTTNECLYPLNTRSLHKFVYKIGSDGEFESCDPSEVPSLKELFALLSTNASQPSDTCQEKKVTSPESSASSCDTPQVNEENAPSETDDHVPEKERNQSRVDCVLYGAKFGSSDKVNIFPIWENKDALCWLDSTLCLLVHSKNLKMYFKSETFGECQLKGISVAYDEAVSLLNSEKKSTRAMGLPDAPFSNLEKVREETFEFLKPFQRCEKGQEDSPVFAIMVLLKQNKFLHSLFLLHFSLELKCNSCGYLKFSQNRKTLVTIPGEVQEFTESQLNYLKPCFQCQKPNQKITMEFIRLPPLLLMHFVKGLPHSNVSLYDLVFSQRGYCVRGFVQYREPERHFITWVRDDTGDRWMCCDDLNPPVQRFETKLPDIPESEIHIVMWEKKEVNSEDNFCLHRSSDENCTDSLSTIESASPPLIVIDDSDSEADAARSHMSHEPLSIMNDPVSCINKSKTCDEKALSISTEKQHEEIIKGNGSSSSSSYRFLSPSYRNVSSISEGPNYVNDKSHASDSGKVAHGDLVACRSSYGRTLEIYLDQNGDNVQNLPSMTQQGSPVQKCTSKDDVQPIQNGNVPNQNVRETDESSLSLVNKIQSPVSNRKQDEDISCASSSLNNVSNNDNESVQHFPTVKGFSVLGSKDEKPKSSAYVTASGSKIVCEDVRDKSLSIYCTENENCLNTELESNTNSAAGCGVCEKSSESKLNLEGCGSPLLEKKDKSYANGQRKACTASPSGDIQQIVKQDTVNNENDMYSDHSYNEEMCRSIRECYVVLRRSEVELYTKTKLVKPDIAERAGPRRKNKGAPITGSSASAPVKEKGRKRKAASLLKLSSLDTGLHDMGNTVKSLASCTSTGQIVSSVSEKHAKEQKGDELWKSFTVESSALGHVSQQSSNVLVPETGSAVFPEIFSEQSELKLSETSQKITFEEQQNVILQNDNSDGTDCHSFESLSMDQSVMKENFKTSCEAVQEEIKNENLSSVHDDLDAKKNSSSGLSVISVPVMDLQPSKNHGLNVQTLGCPSLRSVRSGSLTNLNTLSKTENAGESSCFKLENRKSSTSADLVEGMNSNIVSSSEVFKSDIPTGTKFTGSETSCDESCKCELCAVRRYLQNHEHNELNPQDMSCNAEVGKTSKISDVLHSGSLVTTTSVMEQGLNSTVTVQNKSVALSRTAHGAKLYTEDNLLEKSSCHRAVPGKMPSKKRAIFRQNQNTVSGKEVCKNAVNNQEHTGYVGCLHDKDLNVSQTSEGNESVTVEKSEVTKTELPCMHESGQVIESGSKEYENIASSIKKQKAIMKTGSASVHLFESTAQENLNQSMDMTTLIVDGEKVCVNVEKRAAEPFNKGIKYRRSGRQSKLCVGNTENNKGKVEIQHEESDPCKNSSISKRNKRQEHFEEGADISLPFSDTVVLKKQCKRASIRLNPILSDDLVAPKRKVERKFEPDSVKFVEVPVDNLSSGTESVGDESRCSEMPQTVTVKLNNSSTHKKTGAKKKSCARNVIKYKGITAVFEPFVESEVSETSSIPAREKLISLFRMPSSSPSQSDASNIKMLSCESEMQGVTPVNSNGIDTVLPGFSSVDSLRTHLCSETLDNYEQMVLVKKSLTPGSGNDTGRQAGASVSKNSRGHKKLQKESKGRGESNDTPVLNSEKTSALLSSKQHRKLGSKELDCDIAVLRKTEPSEEENSGLTDQKKIEYFGGTAKKDKCILIDIKKRIIKIDLDSECLENQSELHASQDLPVASQSVAETKKIAMAVNSETEEKTLSPSCQIQEHSDFTRGILTGKDGRKTRDKTVRFCIEPNDSISEQGRKKIKNTSSSESKTSVVQETVCKEVGITVSQEINVKKKRNMAGTPVSLRKKIKTESPESQMQNVDCEKSENQDDQSVPEDNTPVIIKTKPGNLTQEAKPTSSNKPLGFVNPFMYFPKDLTFNYNFSVSVPRPQVRRATCTLKETKSSGIGET